MTARGKGGEAPAVPLTRREYEVVKLLAFGHTNREVAEILHISVRTAEAHRASIRRKLGLSGRSALVRWAAANGALGPAVSTDVVAEPSL